MLNKSFKFLFFSIVYILLTVLLLLCYVNYNVNVAIIMIIISFLYIYFIIKVREGSVIQLDMIFLFFLIVYSFTTPACLSIFDASYSSDDVYMPIILCFIAILGFSIGNFIFNIINIGADRYYLEKLNLSLFEINNVRNAGYALVFVGILISVLSLVSTVGFSTYFAAGYAGRAAIKQAVGPVELGLYVFALGLNIIFYNIYVNGRGKNIIELIICFILIGTFVVYVSYLGVRRPSFLLIVGSLSSILIHKKSTNLKRIVFSFIPLGLFFLTFANYRQVISSYGIVETIQYILENSDVNWLDFSRTELGAPFKSLVDSMGGYFADRGYLLGSSYLSSLIYVFPSSLNGGMVSLSGQYTINYFSDTFINMGGNMGFFPIAEAYLNFGAVGVFFVFTMLGLLFSFFNFKLYSTRKYSPVRVVFFAVLVPWIAFFIRLDFASFLKGFFYSQGIFFILLYFLILFFKKIKFFRGKKMFKTVPRCS